MIYEAYYNGHRLEVDADEHPAPRGLYRCFTLDSVRDVHLTGFLAYVDAVSGGRRPEFQPDHIHRRAADFLWAERHEQPRYAA